MTCNDGPRLALVDTQRRVGSARNDVMHSVVAMAENWGMKETADWSFSVGKYW